MFCVLGLFLMLFMCFMFETRPWGNLSGSYIILAQVLLG